jgi:hypothetical protein
LTFLYPQRLLDCCYIYFHCSYVYKYYNYSWTLCIKCWVSCLDLINFLTLRIRLKERIGGWKAYTTKRGPEWTPPLIAPVGRSVHRIGVLLSSCSWFSVNQHSAIVNVFQLLTFSFFFSWPIFSALTSILPSHLATLQT